jgi:3-oxoacyl-[acyl-carrier-protein] synthase II
MPEPSRDTAASPRDAVITGIGLVSCLGADPAAHHAALNAPGGFAPVVDAASFAPYPVHPIVALDWDRQIPKRQDQRQMEPWQRIGTYAAGEALAAAGLKGNPDLLGATHMIVAAGGGERDAAVDAAILSGLPKAANPSAFLNEHLLTDLRPTLFLAQLSNLLAGNISIVHGVVGSSRTFMGEEASGVDAVRTAVARIRAGQGDVFLVGGSHNTQRPETLMLYAMGHTLRAGPFAAIRARQPDGGMVLASLGAFLVIESRAHAEARGATPIARIAAIASDRCDRTPSAATAIARRQLAAMALAAEGAAVLSGASGVAAPTQEELALLDTLGLPVRATGTALGHAMEPSFIANIALAADAISRGRLFPPLEPGETPMTAPLTQALVTAWGHWRGEGMALVCQA